MIRTSSPKCCLWSVIDDALRVAAINNQVSIKLLISSWKYSRRAQDFFLRSLEMLSKAFKGVDIQVVSVILSLVWRNLQLNRFYLQRRFKFPPIDEQFQPPHTRVNHNKYMVTDKAAYIGTSNWQGNYFVFSAGIGFTMKDSVSDTNVTSIRSELISVFERDWKSAYASKLNYDYYSRPDQKIPLHS